MSKRTYHSLHFYSGLSPFFVVNSLIMHVIVLSFLLTLPMYSKDNEKKSLWGYYVYLTGEETNTTKASNGGHAVKKQLEASKRPEPAMSSEKIINDVKNEETVQSTKPGRDSENADEYSEKIIVENPSGIKTTEINTDSKSVDIKPLSAELKKEEKKT